MMRECQNCQQSFSPQDLSKEASKGLEAERKACGVHGVLFRLYSCSHCGHENLFVDLHPLEGETEEAFHRRREELEQAIQELPPTGADVAIVEKSTPVHPNA